MGGNKALKVCEPSLYARSCLRHRLSGFVWQQEARPLRILGTSKPEKPLHPSSVSPQRNSVPTWRTVSFQKRKVFIGSARNCTSKRSFVTGPLGTLPVSVTGWESSPTPHRRGVVPGCLQRLVQRWHSRMPQCHGEAQAAAMHGSHGVSRAALRF